MYCPVCKDVVLVMADRQGIEVDYCPRCRGVWLDRGELDKIIERAATASTAAESRALQQQDRESRDKREYRDEMTSTVATVQKRKSEGFSGSC
jgi:Zn-finger nucleic acid-binding protein